MQHRKKFRTAAVFVLLLSFCLLSFGTPAYAVEPQNCEHQFTVTITRYATEDADGERLYTCDLCGYSYTEAIPAQGHRWGEWQTVSQPTCTADGQQMRTCTRYPDSPHYEYRAIPATGQHSYEKKITKEATCTKDGELTYTCSVCGNSYTEAIPATGQHSYEKKITKEATCTEDGVLTDTCSVCGDSYTETIPAAGHDYGEWVVDKKATSSAEGHEYRVCKNDPNHTEEKRIAMLPYTGPNTLDYVLTGTLLAGSAALSWPLFLHFYVLSWYKKKKKEFMEQKKNEQKG